MPDYSHLKTRVADSRYAMAAHYLDSCDSLVEIGGSSLHQYMTDWSGEKKFWNIDPSAVQDNWDRVKTYSMPVTAFDFNQMLHRGGPNGLCLLGMEMYDEAYGVGSGIESVECMAKNLHHFDMVVIEFVPENTVARMQALVLLGAAQAVGLERTISMETRWERDSKYPEPNKSFGKLRNFWVLEKS